MRWPNNLASAAVKSIIINTLFVHNLSHTSSLSIKPTNMAAAAPDAYNVHIVPNAVEPPRPERPLPDPAFSRCTLKTRWLSDQHGSNSARYEMIVETLSGRTWLFGRKVMPALFGEVWIADEVTIEDGRYAVQYGNEGRTRRVAVKRMPWYRINRIFGAGAENPMDEIAALGIVSNPGHPNVQRLEAALDDGNTVYLLSPFVDGGEVFQWIHNSSDPYDEARTNTMRRIFRQLVQGMKYNHSKGICHADMSLENALVDMQRRNVCIIDYGKSFLMPVINIDGQDRRFKSIADGRQAKICYCCPETFRGDDYDGVKVDVFAAGSMLYMMLTGCSTFTKPCRRQIDRAINRLRARGVGNQAVDLLERMMAYDPDQRPLPDQVLQHAWLVPQV